MPFNPNIPQPGDKLSQSQQDLLNNNLQLNTTMGINHYPFDDLTAFNGMHRQVQMVEQSVDPTPIVGTNSLFSKTSSFPLGELFFIRGASVTPIQMTSGNVSPNTNGYTFLPGGLLLQWGQTTSSGNGSRNVSFSVTFTSVFIVLAQPNSGIAGGGGGYTTGNVSNSGFRFVSTPSQFPGGTPVSWIAIGTGVGT